ncbi:DNA-binding IclR family transcriptional regulator [Saccharothrix tamanrassetensis]|uniref:DNA-binding IclR family transcriptional regulator n=1 Tax=Saccharothrix tamanrassetensis TaxID=1051531 RepID=A0A841CD26_9PSEU|nr:IclR family transcriptional regulator [Saccharothrix tamanrassetensis]MBB5955279.1 DNA-binding IclR family transcriptional regulator [Saccharothrix tamanrassetensis]
MPTSEPVPRSLLGRAFTLLSVFTADRPSATLSELSRHSGLPLSTTHRLVQELIAHRALDKDGSGRFTIGLRLWELGALSPGALDLRERALPYLEDLFEVTHHNVQLAIRDDLEVVYVERISAKDAVNVVTRMGSRLPLHATGVGLVLLAYAPPEVQERALDTELKQFTKHTITTPNALRSALATVRRDGYAISDRQIETITYSVAAPVRGPGGDVAAAVSVVVPTQTRTDTVLPAVRACGRAISRALGWRRV